MADENLAGTPPPPGFEDAIKTASAVRSPSQNPLTGAPPPEGFNEALYGGLGQQALAGLEGAARGVTLGGSDLFETKVLGVPAENIKGRQEANPWTSGIGNVVGGGALIGLTGGAAAPLEGAALGAEALQVGAQAAEAAIAGGATKAAASAIARTAARAAAGGARALGASMLGYGAEGAIMGAGQSVSDYALGDPNLNAQKVLTNVGMGALLGAGIGAAAHGIHGILGGKVSEVADEANKAAKTGEALASEAPEGYYKKNAPDIIKAAETIGAPAPSPGMVSADKWTQQAESALDKTAPTFPAMRRAKQLEQGWNAVNDTLDSVLDTGEKYGGGAMTKAQLGEALQGSLSSKIAEESAPLNAMAEALKGPMGQIPVPESSTEGLAKELLKMPAAKVSLGEGSVIRSVAKDISSLDTVEDLKNYTSLLKRSLSPTSSPGEKHIVSVLADKLMELEESSIEKAALARAAENPAEAEQIRGLIDQHTAFKRAYAPFRQDLNSLTEQLGKRDAGGPWTAINFIKDLDPEALANKLFDKKFSGFNKFFADKFPEEAALMRQYQKQTLKNAASKAGEFSPKVFFNNVNKMEPEVQAQIFGTDEIAKIKAAELYTRNIVRDWNPSGTAGQTAFRAAMESPLGYATATARDFAIEAFIKGRSMLPDAVKGNPFEVGAELGEKFNKMTAIQKMADDVTNKIQDASKSIFAKNAARGASIGAAVQGLHSYDKASEGVKNLADNPAGIVDHLAFHTGDLHQSVPNITQGLHTTAIAAVDFLNQKLPRAQNKLPLSVPYKPSIAEKSKFMRYYNAVNDPVSVLSDVRHGTVSNEAIEALSSVHPQLLSEMRKYVAGSMQGQDPAKIPYSTKMAVAKFLGQPLDSSMLPHVIQSNQAALSAPQMGTSSALNTGRRGHAHSLSKLNPAGRSATETRDTAEDRE